MARAPQPGLGLMGNFADGENNWGGDMNRNIFVISAISTHYAQSKTAALNANAADGVITIVPAGQDKAGKLAVRYNGGWIYIDPWEGARFYIDDEDADAQYTAAAGWVSTANGLVSKHVTQSFVLDASYYEKAVVCDNGDDINITIPPGLRLGVSIIVKRNGAGNVTIVPAGGVTLDVPDDQTTQLDVRGSTVVLWQDTANAWDMQGRTVAK